MIQSILPDMPDEDTDTGKMPITVKTEDNEFEILFNFVRRATDPSVHTPFASPESERTLYAWPAEKVPNELQYDVDTVEATNVIFETSMQFEELTLLNKPYDESEGIKSPFVRYK